VVLPAWYNEHRRPARRAGVRIGTTVRSHDLLDRWTSWAADVRAGRLFVLQLLLVRWHWEHVPVTGRYAR